MLFSYPSETTLDGDWRTVDDLVNCCVSDLYPKFGFAGPSPRTADLLHVDLFRDGLIVLRYQSWRIRVGSQPERSFHCCHESSLPLGTT
jgi:hypothetical protein